MIKMIQDNQFNSNIMNSIGVDFKLKNVEFEGKLVKMQIVIVYNKNFRFSIKMVN